MLQNVGDASRVRGQRSKGDQEGVFGMVRLKMKVAGARLVLELVHLDFQGLNERRTFLYKPAHLFAIPRLSGRDNARLTLLTLATYAVPIIIHQ